MVRAVALSPCGARGREVDVIAEDSDPTAGHDEGATRCAGARARLAGADAALVAWHAAPVPERVAWRLGRRDAEYVAVAFQRPEAVVASEADLFAGALPAPLDARVYAAPLILALRRARPDAAWIDMDAETCDAMLGAWSAESRCGDPGDRPAVGGGDVDDGDVDNCDESRRAGSKKQPKAAPTRARKSRVTESSDTEPSSAVSTDDDDNDDGGDGRGLSGAAKAPHAIAGLSSLALARHAASRRGSHHRHRERRWADRGRGSAASPYSCPSPSRWDDPAGEDDDDTDAGGATRPRVVRRSPSSIVRTHRSRARSTRRGIDDASTDNDDADRSTTGDPDYDDADHCDDDTLAGMDEDTADAEYEDDEGSGHAARPMSRRRADAAAGVDDAMDEEATRDDDHDASDDIAIEDDDEDGEECDEDDEEDEDADELNEDEEDEIDDDPNAE
jgi:hypothetical protein